MYLAATRRRVEPRSGRCVIASRSTADYSTASRSTERDIRDFLNGKTEGEGLLHALYDHVLDEPVPERLTGAAEALTRSFALTIARPGHVPGLLLWRRVRHDNLANEAAAGFVFSSRVR